MDDEKPRLIRSWKRPEPAPFSATQPSDPRRDGLSGESNMLASFSIVPLGRSESLSRDVAEIVRLVSASGLPYRLGSMETTVEGEPEAVWTLIRRCHELARAGSARVLTHIAIDDREGPDGRIESKIDSVVNRLNPG
jgi:uncharacterized protein (TIGR00106 family)